MKKLFLSLINFVLLFVLSGVTTPLAAQDQSGSVAIASAIRPPAETALENCVVTLVEKAKVAPEKAIAACEKNIGRLAKTATKTANEAADATKASQPLVVNPYGGYGGSYYRSGYGNYGGGYSYRRPIMRPPPPRRLPPSRTPPPTI